MRTATANSLGKASSAPILRFPYRGAPQTVGLLSDSALEAQHDFAVRQLAEAVCKDLDSKDYTSEYLALYYMLLARTRYMRDPRTVELVRSPKVVCREILAGGRPSLDCDDLTVTLGALCLAVGGQVRWVTVAFRDLFYKGRRQYSHVFMQALEPRNHTWLVLDPVAAEKTRTMLRSVREAAIWPVA